MGDSAEAGCSATPDDEADVPADCTVSPASYEISTALAVGAPQTFERTFTVSCANPSFHEFTFLDRLRVGSDGVVDPSPENNSASARVTIPVFGDSDVVVENTALECTDATTVDTDFVCTGRTQVRNNGPFAPTDTDAALGLSAPADCSVTALSRSDHAGVHGGQGQGATLSHPSRGFRDFW